ncbi:MAG: hypothetical protein EP330_17390 [Deltaproteobacteria bacterium]|nr:MAG: hypothetical protein EP330_17390 [Deltaproteobacteria bacterium]
MDKSQKLQRYSRKDYTEIVDFPVEIVGRDGVVRRYSFEDSIRLYQRRVTFAPIRYRDDELVLAEVDHCRSRIDQLRRSYFHRHGWGTPPGEPDPLSVFGPVAGEIAAFLCRVLRVQGRPEVSVSAIDSDDSEVGCYLVRPLRSDAQMTLYVHAFGPADPRRDAFFAQLKAMESSTDPDERLVAFHHTADCGLVITARGEDVEALERWQAEEDAWVDSEPTAYERLVEAARKQEYRTAVHRAEDIVREQPWHRNAYVIGGVVAAHLRDGFSAEEFGLVGSMYFPDDADMHYLAGVGRAEQGRRKEALESLERALELSPSDVSARVLHVLLLLDAAQYRSAARSLRAHQGHDRRLNLLTGAVAFRGMVISVLPAAAIVMAAVAMQTGLHIALLAAGGLAVATAMLLYAWPPLHTLLVPDRVEPMGRGLRRARRATETLPEFA